MINNSKKSFSSDAVKCGKLQIRPLKVLHTPSYLSHLWCYTNLHQKSRIFIGQEHV